MSSARPSRAAGALPTVEEYLASVPNDLDWARDLASRGEGLAPDECFDLLDALGKLADSLETGAATGESEPDFWRHWTDPAFGRPRRPL
jgi:hypothetical protein